MMFRGDHRTPAAVWMALLLVAPGSAVAGLKLSLRPAHASVVRFESIPVFVKIVNDSGKVFATRGAGDAKGAEVTFVIERADQRLVSRTRKEPMCEKFSLGPDEGREIMVDVSRWYEMASIGKYVVRAAVEWEGQSFLSDQVLLDVVNGIEVAEVEREVPGYPDRVRRYSLRYWPRESGEHLFLSVDEDRAHMNYGVFEVGTVLRVMRPAIEVDRAGKVRVTHQSGPDRVTRTLFESAPDGVVFVDQTYHNLDGSPYGVAPAGPAPAATNVPGRPVVKRRGRP